MFIDTFTTYFAGALGICTAVFMYLLVSFTILTTVGLFIKKKG